MRVTETTADSSGSIERDVDGLQRAHHCRRCDQWIDTVVRLRGVAAATDDLDRELVGRGEDRARTDAEGADRHARHVVHAVDLVDGKSLHHAVVQHRLAAGAAFFGGLEDHDSGAVEVARLGEITGRAEEHCRMAVMAARMHDAGIHRGVFLSGGLGDRQGVHIGAKPDHFAAGGPAPANHADDAGAADAGRNLVNAELLETVGNLRRCPMHVVLQLGMAVQIAAPGSDVVLKIGEAVNNRHRNLRASHRI